MNTTRLLLCLLTFCVLAMVPAAASGAAGGQPSITPMRAAYDLQFIERNGIVLHYDMMRPADSARRPLIVLLHGGGWWSGAKTDMHARRSRIQQRLVRAGFVVVAPEYRLTCGTATAPVRIIWHDYNRPARRLCGAQDVTEQVSDVHAIVRYLRNNPDRHWIDGTRVGVVGMSAGGHIGTLAAATGIGDARIQAVSNWGGPVATDFIRTQSPVSVGKKFTIVSSFTNAVGCLFEECPDRWRAADPSQIITRATPRFSVQTVRGKGEYQVTAKSNLEFTTKLTKLGWIAENITAHGRCHGSGCTTKRVVVGPRKGQTAIYATIDFMAKRLRTGSARSTVSVAGP